MHISIHIDIGTYYFNSDTGIIVLENDEQKYTFEGDFIILETNDFFKYHKDEVRAVFFDEVKIKDNTDNYFVLKAKAITFFQESIAENLKLWCEDLQEIHEASAGI